MPLFWVMMLTMLAITLPAPFLLALVMLLLPGRKGNMRTERDVVREDLPLGQAKPFYAERLARDGFAVADTPDPLQLTALRPGGPPGQIEAHGDKPIAAALSFSEAADGVRVRAAVWMNDFIFHDSGEGRLMDFTLNRLLSDDPNPAPPPIVPNHSFQALSALIAALLSIATLLTLLLKMRSTTVGMAAVVMGTVLASLSALLLARQSMAQIRRRPAELLGKGTVIATYVLATLGAGGAIATLCTRFREPVAAWFRQLFH